MSGMLKGYPKHVHKPQLDPDTASMVYKHCIGMVNVSNNEKQAGTLR